MQRSRQRRSPRPAPWLGAWSCATAVERRVVRRSAVAGVVARPSVGCAGRGCGAERQEGVA